LAYNRGDLPAGFIISSAEDMGHFVIAQMNGGRYQDRSVLSPAGIASMHTEPVPNTYAMGWETAQLNGRTLINHDGGLPSFQASVFFDPETRVGVFVAANALDILDALSSPSASSTLDGITSRGMAASVLALASGQPLPDQGPGLGLLTLIMDLVLLALTGALVVALARLPGRYRELARRGVDRWPDLLRRTGLIAGLHLVARGGPVPDARGPALASRRRPGPARPDCLAGGGRPGGGPQGRARARADLARVQADTPAPARPAVWGWS
jgi:hypothetical protein